MLVHEVEKGVYLGHVSSRVRAIITTSRNNAMKQLPVGAIAPPFELQTLAGRPFQLDDAVRGGPVVLAFFKISCPTCQFAFPYLERIHAARSAATPRIVAVSQDEVPETRGFMEKFGLHFEVVIDDHPYPVSSAFGIEYVPGIFTIGGGRSILMSDYGFSKATLNELARGTGVELFSPNDGIPATRPG